MKPKAIFLNISLRDIDDFLGVTKNRFFGLITLVGVTPRIAVWQPTRFSTYLATRGPLTCIFDGGSTEKKTKPVRKKNAPLKTFQTVVIGFPDGDQ